MDLLAIRKEDMPFVDKKIRHAKEDQFIQIVQEVLIDDETILLFLAFNNKLF
jgi:hypothetical protein